MGIGTTVMTGKPNKQSRSGASSPLKAGGRSRTPSGRPLAGAGTAVRPAAPARRSSRPASRRTEPVLETLSNSPVATIQAPPVPASMAPAAMAPAAIPSRLGPRFPEGDYDYTYLHDFMSLDYVPRSCRAVVFGCGKGEEAVFLSERGYRVTGLDSDRNSIGLARERAWLNSRDVDFMIGEVYESATLLPAESFGLASDRGFFRSLASVPGAPQKGDSRKSDPRKFDPTRSERERRRFLDLVRRLLLPGGVFLLNATQVAVGRKAKATRKRKRTQNDLLVVEGGEVMGEVIRSGLEIVGRRQYPVSSGENAGDPGVANLLLYCRKS